MSRKHSQRTRAEILAKRENTQRDIDYGLIQLQPVESRSKYTPHIGAKEQERAKRCRMDYLHGAHSTYNENERTEPTMHQLSKLQYAAMNPVQEWTEYESVF